MRLRNVLFTVSFSFLLFSCDFVTKAYKETFKGQEEDKKNQEVNENNILSESDDEMIRQQEQRISEDLTSTIEEINLFEDAEKLDQIQQQLQAMFPEKSLEIFPPHIYFETKRIRLQLIDPDIPENIDWYYYRAETDTWQKEEPVKTRANDRRRPIPLNTIKFNTTNNIYHQLIEKSDDIEGAEVPSTIYFSFHVPVWNWNARITGSRADYNFKADKDGKEIEFNRQ